MFVLSQHVPGGTEKNYRIRRSGHQVSGQRFEPETFQIQCRDATHSTATFGGITSSKGTMLDWRYSQLQLCRVLSPRSYDLTSCRQVQVHRYFGGIYCLHLQDRRVSQSNQVTQQAERVGLLPVFLVIFQTDVASNLLLENIGYLLPDFTAAHSGMYYS
jgi:hypothetical protein